MMALAWTVPAFNSVSTELRRKGPPSLLRIDSSADAPALAKPDSIIGSIFEMGSSSNGGLFVKLGVAVLGRRFSDNIEHVPIKKRRLLFECPSLRPQTPSPHYEESLSSQPWTYSPQREGFDQTIDCKCVSGQWWCSDSVPNQEMGAFNASAGVQSSRAAACNNISDDAHNVNEGPVMDVFFTSEGADSCISVAPFERTITSSESGNLFLRELAHEDNIDVKKTRDTSATVSPNFHHKRDSDAGKSSSSMKDVRLHWDLNTVMEAWELPCGDPKIGSQGNSSESIPDDSVHSEKPKEFEGYLNSSPSTGSNPISSRPHCNEKMNTSPTNFIIQTGKSWFRVPALQVGQALPMLDPAVSDEVVCEIDNIKSKEDSKKTFHLPDSGTSPTHLACTVTCHLSDVIDYSVCEPGKSGPFHSSTDHENLSALGSTSGEGQPVDVGEKQYMEASPAVVTVMDSLLHGEKELMSKSYECFGEVALEDPIVDGRGLDASHGHTARGETMTQIQVDYKSSFEDGELRELIVRFWEENEVESQTECVDYDSDYRDGDNFDAANQCMPEVGPDSFQNDNNGNLKESSNSVSLNMFPGQDQLVEGRERSYYLTSEANNVTTQKVLASDFMSGLDVVGTSAGEVGSTVTGEKMLFHMEGLSSSDAFYEKDNVYMQRSRIEARGMATGLIPQQTIGIQETVINKRRIMNYPSKGMYRPLIRRRSPAESDDAYSAPRRPVAARGNGYIRIRDRSGLYPQEFNRCPREEYDGSMSENPASSSVRLPHYLARRERSFSPTLNRGANFSQSRGKCRSRSRTRSPVTRHLQIERNAGG
ncbi:hypothetical protein Acr_00g0020950 [Actinidia rufa]|uniref:Uncharacterized protein n=1 Tax=Actinidia rufa TaxID=165716 RepID=A0A7J0DDY6_9ERIC|nr:hypothetical protein Acr_00g0020950 [Actinidia rufa]